MSNLILIEKIPVEIRTAEQNEALIMHNQVLTHKDMIGIGLAGLGQDLKTIRDKKLFVHLGYEQFEDYTEKEHGIKERQAYKYIRLVEQYGIEFLHSSANADIGVTKLLEIAVLDYDGRDKLLNEHSPEELAEMSTPEVKELVAEIANLKKQLTMFEEVKPMPDTVAQKPFEEIEAEIRAEVEEELKAEYEERIFALECKNVSDDELAKYKANAEKEAKAAAAEEQKKLKADLKAALDASDKKDALAKKDAKAIADAEERAKAAEEKVKQAEEDLKRIAELEAKIATAEAEKQAVEKQIKLSADPELTRFKFLFETWQSSTSELAEQLSKLETNRQAKMKAAIRSVVEGMGL